MKRIFIISGIALLGVMGSCTKDFEETNTNPNKAIVGMIQASGMFEPLLYNSANNWLNDTGITIMN
jgi:hypothetical protein